MPTKKKPAPKAKKSKSAARKGKELTDQDLKSVSGGGDGSVRVGDQWSGRKQQPVVVNPNTRTINFTKS